MKDLLHAELNFTPGDGGTTVTLPFMVPEGIKTITARMVYAPSELDDPEQSKALIETALQAFAPMEAPVAWEQFAPLSNLITLSLDDPNGYRGNAHRKDARQTHVLSEAQASPGFLPGAIAPGSWRASIHIHALVTPECRVNLVIDANAKYECIQSV